MRTAVLLALLLAGCGATSGSPVQVPFRAGGAVQGPVTVVTPTGWTVTLTEAKLAVGPFYFNVAPAPTNRFRGGLVIVEVTRQVVVDALDPALHDVPDGADGQSGRAVSVEIGLLPPDDTQSVDDAGALQGAAGVVAGTAVKGGVTVSFRGPIAIDTSLVTPQTPLADLQRVKGASVDLLFTGEPQVLTLRVNPRHLFDHSDFASLPPSSTGQPSTWAAHSTFAVTLVQGVKQETGIYEFELESR